MRLKSIISKEDLIYIYKNKKECPLIEYDNLPIKITNNMYIPYIKIFFAMMKEKK